jgi:hypothetical protein
VEVDGAQGYGRGAGEGRGRDHRQDALDGRQWQGEARTLDGEDHQR